MSRYKPPPENIYTAPPAGSRVLVYVRFSSDGQDGASQESELRRWIGEQGWTVYPGGWFSDEAKSGSTTDGRVGFQAMITLARNMASLPDRPAGVVCWKFNRLGRNVLDVTNVKSGLRRMGYRVIAQHGPKTDDPTLAPILESLEDSGAQKYLADLSLATKRGHAYLRAQGYATGGFPPFGLMEARTEIGARKNGEVRYGVRWVPDPETAPRVVRAFTIKAAGATYVDLLRGPLAGVYRTKSALPPFFLRTGYVTAGVIPQGLFDQVQAVCRRRRRQEGADHPRTLGCGHVLVGMVYCSCGARMAADSWHDKWRYFRCAERQRNPSSTCRQGKVPMDVITEPLLETILSVFAEPNRLAALAGLSNDLVGEDDELRLRVGRLTREIATVDAAIGRLMDALEKEGLGPIRERLQAREAERHRLQNDLLLVQHEIATQRRSTLTAEEVASIVEELRRQRNQADVTELRGIMGMLIQRVTITGREFEVTWKPEAAAWFTPH